MNYKYLSKYHHIYRLSIGGDLKTHLEKFAIAYSNKHYVYIVVPGCDELERAILEPAMYEHRAVFTEFNEEIANRISIRIMERIKQNCYRPFYYYFILDDISPVEEFAKRLCVRDLRKAYLEQEIKDLTERKERFVKLKKDAEYEIANLTLALEKLEETKESAGLPEGVTLG